MHDSDCSVVSERDHDVSHAWLIWCESFGSSSMLMQITSRIYLEKARILELIYAGGSTMSLPLLSVTSRPTRNRLTML